MTRVWTLPAGEDWICDQLVNDWVEHNGDMSTLNLIDADVVWLLSDWRWRSVPYQHLMTKRVVTTVHHITPGKFTNTERRDFEERDHITDVYHVYNQRVADFIAQLTCKPIILIPYWANQFHWKPSGDTKSVLRVKYNLPQDAWLCGSFQRDTEGHDLCSPKLEKGPDLWADAIISMHRENPSVHALLCGWRRQYLIGRLQAAGVPYTYIERPAQHVLRDLYELLDQYVVTARHEGGPQALLECGLLRVPCVSTPVGIAEQVLPGSAISVDVTTATCSVPEVSHLMLPHAFIPYRQLFERII